MKRIDNCKVNIKVEFVRGNVAEYVSVMSKVGLQARELQKLTELNSAQELLSLFEILLPVDGDTEEGYEEKMIAWEIFRGELELYSIYSGLKKVTVQWQKEMLGT